MAKKNKKKLYMVLSVLSALALIFVLFGQGVTSFYAITGNIDSVNLVKNSGFESIGSNYNASVVIPNFPTDWMPSGIDLTHLASVDSTIKHSGSNSLHLQVVNGAKAFYSVGQIEKIPVQAGETYMFEFWVKTSNLPASTGNWNGTDGYPDRVMMEFREFLSNGSQQSYYTSVGYFGSGATSSWDLNINKDWQKVTKYYKIQPGTTSINAKLYLYTTNGDAWIDDVRISKLENDPAVLISNPSFELWGTTYSERLPSAGSDYGTAVSWYAGQFGGIINQSTDAVDGKYSFQLTTYQPNATSHSTYLAQDANFLTIGKKYELSAYIKSPNKVYLHVQRTNFTIGGDTGATWYNGGDTWQKMTIPFVATYQNNQLNPTYRVVVETENKVGATFKVDKVSLKDNGVATACTQLTDCGSTDSCTGGYCMQLACVAGYHAENHLCVKDQITCQAGYTLTNGQCIKNPTGIDSKTKKTILSILFGGLSVFFFISARKK